MSIDGVLAVTLTVDDGRHSAGIVSGSNSDDVLVFNTKLYNGAFTGPTLRANAGDTIQIEVVNALDDVGGVDYDEEYNKFTKAQWTNLHTHGLHVSPNGNSDNSFIEIIPGESFDYEFALHGDQASGLNYYHSQIHGASFLQTVGGFHGSLIVDAIPTVAIQPLLDVPEYIMMISYINARGVVDGSRY